MKKIITTTILAAIFTLAIPAQAKEKTTVFVSKDRIEIQVGLIGYITDTESPDKLASVRVWLGSDKLNYDMSPTLVTYGDFSKVQLTEAQAAAEWAKHVKKFESLKKDLQVVPKY